MTRTLVTGGSGFIGQHLVAVLLARGHKVRVLDNLSTGRIENLALVKDKIEFIEADLCDLAAVEAAAAKIKPGAIVMETVSNPLLRVGEMDKIAEIARAAEAVLIVDNTFATPLLVRPLELGASATVHSATKYLAGHGDVLGGVVVTDKENFDQVLALTRTLGPKALAKPSVRVFRPDFAAS